MGKDLVYVVLDQLEFLDAPAGFQYKEVISFAVAIKAPPIAEALGPIPMLRNGDAVDPTLL